MVDAVEVHGMEVRSAAGAVPSLAVALGARRLAVASALEVRAVATRAFFHSMAVIGGVVNPSQVDSVRGLPAVRTVPYVIMTFCARRLALTSPLEARPVASRTILNRLAEVRGVLHSPQRQVMAERRTCRTPLTGSDGILGIPTTRAPD
jgi:hypothetical protein